jgi:hypothetical protein
MARDFWTNAFSRWQLPPPGDFTDVLEKHPKSTRFLEGYWRRRDAALAAGAIGCSRGLRANYSNIKHSAGGRSMLGDFWGVIAKVRVSIVDGPG